MKGPELGGDVEGDVSDVHAPPAGLVGISLAASGPCRSLWLASTVLGGGSGLPMSYITIWCLVVALSAAVSIGLRPSLGAERARCQDMAIDHVLIL